MCRWRVSRSRPRSGWPCAPRRRDRYTTRSAAAGVSRGTFYNYFRTNAELLAAANAELGNEIVHLIETHVHAIPSPAARLLTGLRLYLDVARRFPLFARFVARVGEAQALTYLRAVLLTLMRGLGLPSDRAESLIAEPLAPLDLSPDSLFMRSQARFRKQKRGKRR